MESSDGDPARPAASRVPFQDILDLLPIAIFVLNRDGSPCYSNLSAVELLGRGVHPEARPEDLSTVYRVTEAGSERPYPTERLTSVSALRGESTVRDDIVVARPTGPVHIEARGAPIFDAEGRVAYAVSTFVGIDARVAAEASLRESEEGYRLLFDGNPAPMWVYDVESLRFLAVNDAAVVEYGYHRDEFLTMTIEDIRTEDEAERLRASVHDAGTAADRSEGWIHLNKAGEERVVEVISRPVVFDGRQARLVLANDITDRRRIETERDSLTESLQMLLHAAAEGIYGLDVSGRCTFVNVSAAKLLGYASDDLLGRHMHDLVHHHRADGSEYPVAECPIAIAIRAGRGILRETDLLWRRDGTSFPVEYRAEPILREGVVVGAVVSFVDITDRRASELRMRTDAERLAATDPLTGVGNRRHARTLLQVTAPGDALVMVDLDHFKRVNDTEGHAAGDAVLVRLAGFLRQSLRDSDLFARYGGEEFLLVVRAGTDPIGVVERLQRAWRSSDPPVTFSAGLAVRRRGEAPEMTLARADEALYRAKAAGRDRAETAD